MIKALMLVLLMSASVWGQSSFTPENVTPLQIHAHTWEDCGYGLYPLRLPTTSTTLLPGTTSGDFQTPAIAVEICSECRMIRVKTDRSLLPSPDNAFDLGPQPSQYSPVTIRAIAGDKGDYSFELLTVRTRGYEKIGSVSADGKVVTVAPGVARACSVPRFKRNMWAALRGSKKAGRYLGQCAEKLSQEKS